MPAPDPKSQRPQRIAVLPGDGIGRDVTAEAVRVLEAAAERWSLPLDLVHLPYGADHYLATARPVKNTRSATGVLQRVKADLRAIAFVREGAFQGAQVLAIREAQTFDEELLPVDMDPELVQRLRAHGVALPDRYQAHPETDTPDESGTSADGARLDTSSQDEGGVAQ